MVRAPPIVRLQRPELPDAWSLAYPLESTNFVGGELNRARRLPTPQIQQTGSAESQDNNTFLPGPPNGNRGLASGISQGAAIPEGQVDDDLGESHSIGSARGAPPMHSSSIATANPATRRITGGATGGVDASVLLHPAAQRSTTINFTREGGGFLAACVPSSLLPATCLTVDLKLLQQIFDVHCCCVTSWSRSMLVHMRQAELVSVPVCPRMPLLSGCPVCLCNPTGLLQRWTWRQGQGQASSLA